MPAKKILPHGALKNLAPDIWILTGSIPNMKLPRNMVVFRHQPDALLIHSPIALNEDAFKALDHLGEVQLILVPNSWHRLDGGFYKDRYPMAKLICPEASRKLVSEKMHVDAICEEELQKIGITFHLPEGIKPNELAYEFKTKVGTFLVCSDLLFNVPHLSGFGGLILRLMGSSGSFKMTPLAKFALLKNKNQFRTWLLKMSAKRDLAGVLMAHGDPILSEVEYQLRLAAERL